MEELSRKRKSTDDAKNKQTDASDVKKRPETKRPKKKP